MCTIWMLKINDEADKVIEEPFKLLLNRYKTGLETTMKGGDFIFVGVSLLAQVNYAETAESA